MTEVQTGNVALLAQADLLFLLARLFCPPTPQGRAGFDAAGFDSAGSNCAELVARAGLGRRDNLTAALAGLHEQALGLDLSEWAAEYNRVFECAVPCPINESGFVRRDKGAILGDIAGFYRAFGFELADGAAEKVDHLVCELEFVAMLLVLLAKARDEGNRAGAEVSRDALRAFAFDHIGEWLPAFCDRLQETTSLSFYQRAAAVLSEVWNGICRDNRLPVPKDGPHMGREAEPDRPFVCGLAGLSTT
ncbi:MAG: molecular chaperone [Kiloniellaceae bacterium]